MSIRIISLALAATAAFAVPAAAETQTTTRGVQYKDLDLATEAGQKELENRLDSAAREVCGVRRATLIPIEIRVRFDNCAEDATARAIADVNAPLLKQHREIVVRN